VRYADGTFFRHITKAALRVGPYIASLQIGKGRTAGRECIAVPRKTAEHPHEAAIGDTRAAAALRKHLRPVTVLRI